LREPEYLMCLECNTHCFNFDWIDDKLVGAVCAVCGNEDLDRFESPEEDTLSPAD
jgi:hypothetical protein